MLLHIFRPIFPYIRPAIFQPEDLLIEQYADDFLEKQEVKEALKIAWEKIAKTQPRPLFIIPDNSTT